MGEVGYVANLCQFAWATVSNNALNSIYIARHVDTDLTFHSGGETPDLYFNHRSEQATPIEMSQLRLQTLLFQMPGFFQSRYLVDPCAHAYVSASREYRIPVMQFGLRDLSS